MAEAGKRLVVRGRDDSAHVLNMVDGYRAGKGESLLRVQFVHSAQPPLDRCPNGCKPEVSVQPRDAEGNPSGKPQKRITWVTDARGWHVCEIDQTTDYPGVHDDAIKRIVFVPADADDTTIANAIARRADYARKQDVPVLRPGEVIDLDDSGIHWFATTAVDRQYFFEGAESHGAEVLRVEFSEMRASRKGQTSDAYDVVLDVDADRQAAIAAMYERAGLEPPSAGELMAGTSTEKEG